MAAVEDGQLVEKRFVNLVHVVPIRRVDAPENIIGVHAVPERLENIGVVITGIAGGFGARGDGLAAAGKHQETPQKADGNYAFHGWAIF